MGNTRRAGARTFLVCRCGRGSRSPGRSHKNHAGRGQAGEERSALPRTKPGAAWDSVAAQLTPAMPRRHSGISPYTCARRYPPKDQA
jgi:hypothetical protein